MTNAKRVPRLPHPHTHIPNRDPQRRSNNCVRCNRPAEHPIHQVHDPLPPRAA
jgi:hypothetical protein